MILQAGQVLAGRYKLLRPLGQGSQAFVWVAEHLALGSQVAVKLIDPELAKQADARERFAREASAAAKLRSAHVVHIVDHGIEGEQPFIVMELLEGEDLFDRLERRKRLTLSETSKILTQVARALMRAHAEGIVHRDLKPENVFLVRNEDDELAKVLDFGVAKITNPAKASMTRTGVGTLIGTPHYMSPEQVKGLNEIDHRSDLWSLGVIAYQCVTGQLPFDSEGVGDLLIRITMSEPQKPSQVVPGTADVFDAWFKKASAKEPDDRFQTAREMADALASAAGVSGSMSQPGSVLVNLGDSPDLDWGSLAGVRIPMPAKKAESANELVQESDDQIQVFAASRPPSAAPETDGHDANGPAEPQRLTENPFLAMRVPPPPKSASRVAPPASPVSSPQKPAARTLTVSGLASTSQPPGATSADFEPSRRRRATWFVVTSVALVSIGVAVGVIRSRGGFAELAKSSDSAPPAAAPPQSQEPTQHAGQGRRVIPPGLSASAVPTASDQVVDLNVTKKPTKPVPTAPPRAPKRLDEEGVEIVIPEPYREVRVPRR